MKQTEYFKNKVLTKRPYLKLEWIDKVLANPIKKEVQENNRIRYWAFIKELDKYLRVVILEDGATIYNAFPDRDFKEKKK